MTKAEYQVAYKDARNKWPKITAKAMSELKKTYTDAAKKAADAVRDAQMLGRSAMQIQSAQDIARELQSGADAIALAIETVLPASITKGYQLIAEADVAFIMSAVEKSTAPKITEDGLLALTQKVNQSLLTALVSNIWADGKSYSERVWDAANDYTAQINTILQAGLAQGRDLAKIARDIEIYIKDGKNAVIGRYGKLLPGTREYIKRLRQGVDYRSLRLVRSEFYKAMQDAAVKQGENNPGATGWYNWILSPGRQDWSCECPSNAAGSPYQAGNIPSFPHPNCFCAVSPVLRDTRTFIDDLKSWSNDEPVEYLDDWYKNIYLAANR